MRRLVDRHHHISKPLPEKSIEKMEERPNHHHQRSTFDSFVVEVATAAAAKAMHSGHFFATRGEKYNRSHYNFILEYSCLNLMLEPFELNSAM